MRTARKKSDPNIDTSSHVLAKIAGPMDAARKRVHLEDNQPRSLIIFGIDILTLVKLRGVNLLEYWCKENRSWSIVILWRALCEKSVCILPLCGNAISAFVAIMELISINRYTCSIRKWSLRIFQIQSVSKNADETSNRIIWSCSPKVLITVIERFVLSQASRSLALSHATATQCDSWPPLGAEGAKARANQVAIFWTNADQDRAFNCLHSGDDLPP